MDRETLRSVQKPLKQQYRERPQDGIIVLRASGTVGEDGPACSVQAGRDLVTAGLHPSTGGDGSLACSGDLLLQALVACAGVTLSAVAINRSMLVTGNIRAEGELDVRGTLGLDPEVPVGFRTIRLFLELQTDAPEEDVRQLIETTEKYCVVLQTLRNAADIELTASSADAPV